MALFRGEKNAISADGKKISIIKVISESLKFIANKAL